MTAPAQPDPIAARVAPASAPVHTWTPVAPTRDPMGSSLTSAVANSTRFNEAVAASKIRPTPVPTDTVDWAHGGQVDSKLGW